ncbi:MAG: PLDc N-terminal domain-containing protein [Pseudolabrys sp.]
MAPGATLNSLQVLALKSALTTLKESLPWVLNSADSSASSFSRSTSGPSCARSRAASNGAKVIWLIMILLLPVTGLLIWLLAGPK